MKSLSYRQHHRNLNPIKNAENRNESHRQQEECLESEGGKNGNEEKSDNVSSKKGTKRQKIELQGEFKIIKPLVYNGEAEEATEDWSINMNKYFQIYEYDENLRVRLAIYQLRGKYTLWWEEIKTIEEINEQEVTWEQFQKHFKYRYLTEWSYDDKEEQFHNLKLGQQSMDEFVAKLTLLLRYVPYIHEEKAKVQCFISSLPIYMKEKLEFDNLKMMDEVVRKGRIYYHQMKQKGEGNKNWTSKKGQIFTANKNMKNVGTKYRGRK